MTTKLTQVLCILGALAVFFAAGCSSDANAPKNLTATINVVGGKAQGGEQTLTVKKGGNVNLTVNSDTADEIHIHGYDFHKDVEKGGSVNFNFPAKFDGQFVIELEAAKQQIATLRVEP